MKITISNDQERVVRVALGRHLIDASSILNYLNMQIEAAHELKDKDKFPGNTDKDVQYFENMIELYTGLINIVNFTARYDDLLRMIILKER